MTPNARRRANRRAKRERELVEQSRVVDIEIPPVRCRACTPGRFTPWCEARCSICGTVDLVA